MAREISKSVGQGGVNIKVDVETIQDLLNQVPRHTDERTRPLKIDGIVGRKTISAIRRFQKQHAGFRWPDCRVDPGGKTLAKLNEFDQGPSTSFFITRAELHFLKVKRTYETIDRFFVIWDSRQDRRALYWFGGPKDRLAEIPSVMFREEWTQFLTRKSRSVLGFECHGLYSDFSENKDNVTMGLSLILSTGVSVVILRHRWHHPTTTPKKYSELYGNLQFVYEIRK